MYRSQRILLKPNNAQLRLIRGAAGLSRFAWNWAVALCQRHYRMFGKRKAYRRPTTFTLSKHWNKVKDRRFAWVRKYSSLTPRGSFDKLDKAYKACFSRLRKGQTPGFPRFHKKGVRESFEVSSKSNPMKVCNRRINLPRIGFVRMETLLRWPSGKQVYDRVKLVAGRWWLTLRYELPDSPKLPAGRPTCGIDLGCATLATVVSGGEVVEKVSPLKPYAKAKRKLQRAGRVVSRRFRKGQKQSRRYRIAKLKLAKAHERIANLRSNQLHQLTSRLVKRFGVIVLEDLSVKGMAAGMLAGTIRDTGFGEFRRHIEYKAGATGTKVIFADRWYPSSKACSACGRVKTKLDLSERVFCCEGCGFTAGRDANAAMNLEKLGQSMPEVTRGESGEQVRSKGRAGAARGTANAHVLRSP